MEEKKVDSIAIIGMSGRFPGAKSVAEFWANLCAGQESITFFSDQELRSAGVAEEMLRMQNYIKAKAILEEVDLFDADFFGFSPREAEALDPQQRLFLESVWQALEDAGYCTEKKAGRTGIYAGLGINNYYPLNLLQNDAFKKLVDPFQLMMSNVSDTLCTRASYEFDLTGPSYTIQTACSTSLVAVAVACQGLLDYQCDLALAGGVSLPLPIKTGYLYKEGMILSPDGHCRPFDKSGQGTVNGMGLGLVVLKRLDAALQDRDSIYAVIKGFAINNDGAKKIGFMAPSIEGQAAVISEAQAMANIPVETITYVETHGTGTTLGDPIEIAALTSAFEAMTDKKQFCAIGSVKSNIGHLDVAAGIAGLIKTTLALHHRLLPPSLHFKEPNSQIDFQNSPFYVNAKLSTWNMDFPRRAGVSSFGIGGTNVHMILEEAPPQVKCAEENEWHLFVLSAKSALALEKSVINLVDYLKNNSQLTLSAVAYTLCLGRKSFDYRRAILIKNKEDLVDNLTNFTINSEQDKSYNVRLLEQEFNHFFAYHAEKILQEDYNQLQNLIRDKLEQDQVNLPLPASQGKPFKAIFLALLGKLWVSGININWDLLYLREKPGRISLPTYPFQSKKYWIESDPSINKEAIANCLKNKVIEVTATTETQAISTTEKALIIIWQENFGIEKINIEDDFFALGGNSLLAVEIIYKINQYFNSNLSPGALLTAPRIVDLAKKLQLQQEINNQIIKQPFSIITLKTGNKTIRPLFLIHPIGGTVYFYRELAAYLPDYLPVYGLQARSLDGKTPIRHTIEEIAADYLQDIIALQPKGPYRLVGASFGGIVAYEIARVLHESGAEVDLLCMIDSYIPEHLPSEEILSDTPTMIQYLLEVGNGHKVGLDYLRSLTEDQLMEYFIKNTTQQLQIFKDNARLFFEIFRLNLLAMLSYQPKLYNGRAIFFKALELNNYIPDNIEKSWEPYLLKGLDIIGINGNHITMTQNPHVQKLANYLRLYIQ